MYVRDDQNLPGVSGKVGQLPSQREELHFASQSHLVMRVELAMPDERQQPVW